MDRYLNIIALNIPWPPNYGGIIDIYYKIKALHALGIKIILHCFEYERGASPELDSLCDQVYYYKRRTGLK
ncbi:MAG: glycosyltransferase family 1 protein, partial [Tannerellaceae bacterium]|nr:glycosyltransferase family 1 protein [Tannerellaceae bacterium]